MRLIKLFLFAFAFVCLAPSLTAQPSAWMTLSRVTWKKAYDELLGFSIDKPVFSDGVKEMNGEVIRIKGYIVPVEGYKNHKEFILSAYPYNMCFFCGGAGPETVIEVSTNTPVQYTADPIILSGTLVLNADDPNRLMYALINAEEVDSEE